MAFTPQMLNLIKVVNPTPCVTQAQKHHLQVLIGQMDFFIDSPKLAGWLVQYSNNWEVIAEN